MATIAVRVQSAEIPLDCGSDKVQELTDLIQNLSPRFRRIALSRLGNVADAEDAVQDAILAALTHVDQFRGQAKMSTWLTAIVVNSALMKLRRRSRANSHVASSDPSWEENFSLADFASDSRPNPEQIYQTLEVVHALGGAISGLSPTLLRAFQLRDIQGGSIRDIARILGVPIGTVKARTARARKKLRNSICARLGLPSSN
jgi:RNA polymerase sigma-70 factor, ECF subfamily